MSTPVKSKRSYDASRRRAQAEATRREILETAERLFVRDGYAPTTMAAIATEAGVAAKTVYLAFETKSGLLRALWHLRLRGDADESPMQERDWFRSLLEEPDPERKLRAMARQSTTVKQRIGPLMAVIHAAAPLDPDIRDLWARIQSEFHGMQVRVVDAIKAGGALRRGLRPREAADVLWTLHHPVIWQLLVAECGWTAKQYERWTSEASIEQLLGRS
jgi:AcrR family transcriptional regulator